MEITNLAFATSFMTLLITSINTSEAATPTVNWTLAKASVWDAVQIRWQAWQQNDQVAYMSAHHDAWHRWSLSHSGLEGKSDMAGFWKSAKRSEQTTAFILQPLIINIYGNNQFASVHYVAEEDVRLLEARITREGRVIPAGTETKMSIRFSDYLVLEGDDWQVIGGYRDGSCALFKGFGRLCE
jgi:hypothetical protein